MADPTPAQRRVQALKNIARLLVDCRRRFEAGEKAALADAIYWCISYNMPLPKWARQAYEAGYQAISDLESLTWDDVFGKPNAGKRKIKSTLRARNLDPKIFHRVMELRRQKPRPRDIFGIVAAEEHIDRKTVEKHFYRYFHQE